MSCVWVSLSICVLANLPTFLCMCDFLCVCVWVWFWVCFDCLFACLCLCLCLSDSGRFMFRPLCLSLWLSLFSCFSLYASFCMSVCVWVWSVLYVFVCESICLWVYVCWCLFLDLCLYVGVWFSEFMWQIHTHTQTHTHTHTHTGKVRLECLRIYASLSNAMNNGLV